MRGITIAVFFTVCIIATSVAAPSKWGNKNSGDQVTGDVGESIYPTGKRTRPISSSTKRGGQGPFLFFREPRSQGGTVPRSWGGIAGTQSRPGGSNYWPRYAIRGRDDDESEEEEEDEEADDIGDDDGSDEEYAFDTPDWDDIYPKEETGPYARRNTYGQSSGGVSYQDTQRPQGDSSYTISPGSPGGPPPSSGRSGFNTRPKNWGPGRPSQRLNHRQQRRGQGPVFIRVPKQNYYEDEDVEGPSSWYGQQGPSRWSSAADTWNSNVGPVYYKPASRPNPQYVRRSWNWRPSPPRPQQIESDEDSVEVKGPPPRKVWPGASTGGPRHVVKNWSRTQSPTWGPSGPKWGYY